MNFFSPLPADAGVRHILTLSTEAIRDGGYELLMALLDAASNPGAQA